MNKPLLLGALVGVALFVLVSTAKAQIIPKSAAKAGPPRYVDGYDRLPSLQAELAKRQEAVSIATRVVQDLDTLAKYRPLTASEATRGQDMLAIIIQDRPIIGQLQAAIDQIAAAGQM